MSNIVPSSNGSGFSSSELALIKSGQWLPELSHFVPVTLPRNLDDNLNHARDEGEKIDLLIHTALNPHAPALVSLGEFLNRRDVTILAATLRGFASIGETLKEQNLDPDYRHHLEKIRYVLTANLDLNDDDDQSVHLFKRLCHDAESGESEIVRWAASHALQELDYPLNLRLHLLLRPPAEILAEIWNKYESRLSDQKRKNDPSKVLEDVKFGIYAHTERLFAECKADNSFYSTDYSFHVTRQVLRKSGIRGIRLALKCGNKPVVVEAINFAGELFNQIDRNSQDKRYVDPKTRQKLAALLLPFIDQPDLELRNLVAEKLNDKRNNYNVSNSLIAPNYRAKVAVIDTDWNRAILLGDVSISVLCEAIQGSLRIEDDEDLNVNCQIESIKTIDKILIDISQKVSILSPYLQHNSDKLRLEVALLLQTHQSSLDSKSLKILIALLFTLDLPEELDISISNSRLNRSIVESYIQIAESYKESVENIFVNAIAVCEKKSNSIQNFLSKEQKSLSDRIENYLCDLEELLDAYDDEIERQKLCKKILEDKASVQNQIRKLEQDIEYKRRQVDSYSSDLHESSDLLYRKENPLIPQLNSPLFCYFIMPFVLIIPTLILSLIIGGAVASALFYIVYFGTIINSIIRIFSTNSEKEENQNIASSKSQVERKITQLERQRNELGRQLSAIESQIRENKCI